MVNSSFSSMLPLTATGEACVVVTTTGPSVHPNPPPADVELATMPPSMKKSRFSKFIAY